MFINEFKFSKNYAERMLNTSERICLIQKKKVNVHIIELNEVKSIIYDCQTNKVVEKMFNT